VPKICTAVVSAASPRNSRSRVAIEYTSSPVEQPGTQMRIGSPRARPSISFGKTSVASAS
jgi:hypothetical protein